MSAKKLLVVGFNATEHRRDNSFYDLLASEARLASFVAIAKGDALKLTGNYTVSNATDLAAISGPA